MQQYMYINTVNHAGIYIGPKGEEEVAIKIPKTIWNTGRSPLEVEDLKAFYAEAQLALEFSHENVLSCIGISSGVLVKTIFISSKSIAKCYNWSLIV